METTTITARHSHRLTSGGEAELSYRYFGCGYAAPRTRRLRGELVLWAAFRCRASSHTYENFFYSVLEARNLTSKMRVILTQHGRDLPAILDQASHPFLRSSIC